MENRISPITGKPISASAGSTQPSGVPLGAFPLAGSTTSGSSGQVVNRELFDQFLQSRPPEPPSKSPEPTARDNASEQAGASDDEPEQRGKAERADEKQEAPRAESTETDSVEVDVALSTVDLALQAESEGTDSTIQLDEIGPAPSDLPAELAAETEATPIETAPEENLLAAQQIAQGEEPQSNLPTDNNSQVSETVSHQQRTQVSDSSGRESITAETVAQTKAVGEQTSVEPIQASAETESSISASAAPTDGQAKDSDRQSPEQTPEGEQSPADLRPDFVDADAEQTDDQTKWFQRDPHGQQTNPLQPAGPFEPYPSEPGSPVHPVESINNIVGDLGVGTDTAIVTPGSNNSLTSAPSPSILVPPTTVAAGTTTSGSERAATLERVASGNAAGTTNIAPTASNRNGPVSVGAPAAGNQNNASVNSGQSVPGSAEVGADDITQQERVRLIQRVSRSFSRLTPQGGEMNLRLHPPQLGSLAVRVRLDGNTMSAELSAESEAARDIITENLPILRRRLADQGIEISHFQVDVGNDTADNQSSTGQSADRNPNSGLSGGFSDRQGYRASLDASRRSGQLRRAIGAAPTHNSQAQSNSATSNVTSVAAPPPWLATMSLDTHA